MVVFITDCLRLITGGSLDPHELESLLEYELRRITRKRTSLRMPCRKWPTHCPDSASWPRCSAS